MNQVTIYHNPRCSTSRYAKSEADDAGLEITEVQYLKNPLSEAELRDLISKLEDPVTDLVRRDSFFKE